MIFKILFISVFSFLLIYSFIRPFSSRVSRFFLFFGSILGILSLVGVEYTQIISDFFGIGRAVDLYLYLGLVTIFLFITYAINRFESLEKRNSSLIQEIAILESKLDDLKKEVAEDKKESWYTGNSIATYELETAEAFIKKESITL